MTGDGERNEGNRRNIYGRGKPEHRREDQQEAQSMDCRTAIPIAEKKSPEIENYTIGHSKPYSGTGSQKEKKQEATRKRKTSATRSSRHYFQ